MSLNLTKLFSLEYLFNLHPEPLSSGFFSTLVIIFGLMVISGLAINRLGKKSQNPIHVKLFQKIRRALSWLGILGIAWLFFRHINAGFLNARFWMVLWLLGLIVWVFFITRYYLIKLKPRQEKIQEFKVKQKYLKK